MMNKKGVELSMNVIIIAAIGLLVLVILAVLVINSTSKVPNATSCISSGGVCKATCGTGTEKSGSYGCPATAAHCCEIVSLT